MTILDGYQEFAQGDTKNLRFKWWDADDPTLDVSAATVTCILYGPDRAVVLASGSMSKTGTTVLDCKRAWSPTTEAPGKYRCVAKVVYNGSTIQAQWAVKLLPSPAPE